MLYMVVGVSDSRSTRVEFLLNGDPTIFGGKEGTPVLIANPHMRKLLSWTTCNTKKQLRAMLPLEP